MEKYKFVFIVLVYLNSDDLVEFIKSVEVHLLDYKIVVVNSYHDDESMHKIEKIALDNNCDFINVENRGYSYGNNQGIRYATTYYIFDYAIISNPDVTIEKFDMNVVDKHVNHIIAPLITAKSGKRQNPLCARNNKICEKLKYYGYKKDKKLLLYTGIAINKIIRELFLLCFLNGKKESKEIFAAHGSFVIIPAKIIQKMKVVYDEGMFLFSEEMVIAYKMQCLKEKTIITKNICINHKEDGSQKISDISYDGYESKSMIYCFEKYVKFKKAKNESDCIKSV